LGYDNKRGKVKIKRPFMTVLRMGWKCRQIRAETYLQFLRQNILHFRRQSFKGWMEAFTAEEHNAIHRVRLYREDAHGPGFWKDVGKLGGLEEFILLVTNKEDTGERKYREKEIRYFSKKLNKMVGHKVELEVIERERWSHF
jgi:hypothetical protein